MKDKPVGDVIKMNEKTTNAGELQEMVAILAGCGKDGIIAVRILHIPDAKNAAPEGRAPENS